MPSRDDFLATSVERGESRPVARSWTRSRDAAWSAGVLVAAIAGYAFLAVRLGADGNADLRNYHYYSGWALLHKHVGTDIIPAQLQTYHHPLLDAIYWLVLQPLNARPFVFTAVWSIPQAVTAWIMFHVALIALGERPGRHPLAALAAAIGAGGATTLGVVGTSMSEALPNMVAAGAIWLVLTAGSRWDRPVLAGVLAGAAAVLKLTMVSYLLAFAPAMLAAKLAAPSRPWLRTAVLFGVGAALGLAALGGPWWWAVYREFGNPLFPYYNAWFRSPLYTATNFFDDRFLPRSWLQWLDYPLLWSLRKSRLVSEEPVRDLRVLLEVVAALLILAAFVARRWRAGVPAIWLATYTLGAYALWLKTFSILRYASGLEAVSGVMIVVALAGLTRRAWLALGGTAAMAAVLFATTVVPTWERRRHPTVGLLSVSMRPLPPDSTVLILVATPASYVAAWQPPSVRFIGLNNNLLRLDSTFGLQAMVERAIKDAPGPIWGIENLSDFFGQADQTLARYRLRRTDDCSKIESTLDTALQVCRLERLP